MNVERLLPTPEAAALLELVHEVADREIRPRVEPDEAAHRFPRDLLRTLGGLGLLGLPYPEEHGGGGQPYEVYLQVLEELARSWLTVGISVSVHTLACYPVAEYGSSEQRARWLPEMLAGDLLGAYCLSEPESGSDAAALRTRATLDGGEYVLNGTKAWITHSGLADWYSLMARTSDTGSHGISCLVVPGDAAGLSGGAPERKMGMGASLTAQVLLDDVRVPADRLIGAEGQGFTIALSALDAGRLGIAACSVGLAQAALDTALAYAKERRQFGQPIVDFQGVGFMLADMAAAVEAARALYLHAARRKDAGMSYTREAAMAKLVASDSAMRVTTDAVQVLGGYGYVQDFPVERYMREAKVLQIVEGTSQIQRLVISRRLVKES
ncbi:MAG: acyl-CoA dehydrogenase [Streptosporangiales bacterium]|nr:acyl-CoA dehydrogenase [Streptosporangiales bacterium]